MKEIPFRKRHVVLMEVAGGARSSITMRSGMDEGVRGNQDEHGLEDFGDFGVSFAATVAGRCTRRGDPRLSV